ncbi:hypothetical protein VP06_30795 [Methylobacterium aquaticum]|uniref:Uncharacterized protein n=2 Tax=Methylobacterium aquaticum TaxID=270351 RepID=A0A0J6S1I0_9HYPH|nr:hypothetical protein VP06_30795 [Methylobacterium aquaticum]
MTYAVPALLVTLMASPAPAIGHVDHGPLRPAGGAAVTQVAQIVIGPRQIPTVNRQGLRNAPTPPPAPAKAPVQTFTSPTQAAAAKGSFVTVPPGVTKTPANANSRLFR